MSDFDQYGGGSPQSSNELYEETLDVPNQVTHGKGRGSFWDTPLGKTADVATTAADAATLGMARPVAGVLGAASEFASDPIGTLNHPGNIPKAFSEGYGKTNEALKQSRENIPPAFAFGAELLGGTRGAAKYADEAIEVGTRKFAPSTADKVKNYAATFAAGVPVAAADSYVRGDSDLMTAALDGVFAGALGTTMQAVGGDMVIPLLQRVKANKTGKTPLGEAVMAGVDTGLLQDGASFNRLLEIAQNPAANKSLLDMDFGNVTKGSMASRYYDALANLEFATPDARKINTAEWAAAKQNYDATLVELKHLRDDANKNVQSEMADVLFGTGPIAPTIQSPEYKKAITVMDSLGRTAPGPDGVKPLGAYEMDAEKFVDDSLIRYTKELGYDNPEHMTGKERQVWRAFKELYRGVELETVARGLTKISSEGRDYERADEIFSNIPIARLFNSRKDLMDLMTPGLVKDSSSITKQQRRAIMKLGNIIDDELDAVTGKQAGIARGVFAKAMKEKNAEALGEQVYLSRGGEIADERNFSAEYGQTIDEFFKNSDDNTKEAFTKGFKKGMHKLIGKRGIQGELHNYLGTDVSDATKVKQENLDTLYTVLGKAEADRIVGAMTESAETVKYRNNLVRLFEAKGRRKQEAEKLADAAIKAQAEAPATNAVAAGFGFLKKSVAPSDVEKVEAIQALLTAKDGDLSDLLRQGIEEAAPGGGAQLGVRTTAAGAPLRTEEDRSVEDQYDLGAELERLGRSR